LTDDHTKKQYGNLSWTSATTTTTTARTLRGGKHDTSTVVMPVAPFQHHYRLWGDMGTFRTKYSYNNLVLCHRCTTPIRCGGQLLYPKQHGTRRRGTVLLLTTGPITTPATYTNTTKTTAEAIADDCNKTVKHWNMMFEKVKAYKEVHGNCTVPFRYVCDDVTKLGLWVSTQRRVRIIKDAALRERRRQELDAIGFVWVVNKRNRQLTPVAGHASKEERFNARWNVMFNKLKEYKAVHGDCLEYLESITVRTARHWAVGRGTA
jgi:predicted secreted Zn-dependent protease